MRTGIAVPSPLDLPSIRAWNPRFCMCFSYSPAPRASSTCSDMVLDDAKKSRATTPTMTTKRAGRGPLAAPGRSGFFARLAVLADGDSYNSEW